MSAMHNHSLEVSTVDQRSESRCRARARSVAYAGEGLTDRFPAAAGRNKIRGLKATNGMCRWKHWGTLAGIKLD